VSSELRFSPPPRTVPASLVIANVFNLFGQIAWAVLGFGMIVFWVFAVNADLSFIRLRGPLANVEGEVVRVERTSFGEGSKGSSRPIYANHYMYFVAGRPLTAVSYSVGRSAQPGERVTVEYVESAPARSRIRGMRGAPFGASVLPSGIFALAGLVMVIVASAIGWRRTRLLQAGHLAMGRLTKKQPTNTKVNGRVVHELTFEFAGRDGRRHEVTARTSLSERLEDEKQEPLLYDPARPSRAYLLDQAPSRPRFGPTGELLGAPRPALRLLLPALVAAANGWILLRLLN
jgi:hypothetical protein